MSFLWCDLESSVPIHPCLIFYLYSSAFPKVTVNEREDDQNDIYIYVFYILSAEDIKHERPGAKVWKAAAWVISCSGEIVGAQTILLHDLGILDGFLLFPYLTGDFFSSSLSQELLDLTEVIWENPWKVWCKFKEEIHLSESHLKNELSQRLK